MTISEASAVNVLLNRIFGVPATDGGPSDEQFGEAAVYLSERANKALMAGWDGSRVREAMGALG